MAHSDDDVLDLGNKSVSGTKRKFPGDSSSEEKEKEDRGFQVESPEKEESPDNKRARTEEENVPEEEQNQLGELGCSPDVAYQMMNHSRFFLLLKRGPIEARDYSLITEARNLIGQVQFLAMDVTEYPDFTREFPDAGRIPCVTLFHGFQVLDWCAMNEDTTAEDVAALGAPDN